MNVPARLSVLLTCWRPSLSRGAPPRRRGRRSTIPKDVTRSRCTAPHERTLTSGGVTTKVYENIVERQQFGVWTTTGPGIDADAALDAYRLSVPTQYPNVELLGETRLLRNGVPDIEMFFEYDNNRRRVRERLQYYVDGGTVYILLYAAEVDRYSEEDAARFLDSFRIRR